MNIITLNLKDIRVNRENIYDQDLIEELADSIKNVGQLENTIVYEDKRNDGKQYTLIGGHRRYAAIAYLAERGEWKEGIKVNVIDRPEHMIDEKMLIVADNHQRTKDTQTREKEIMIALEAYEKLKAEGKKPQGKKRDWVAKKVGLSPRWVQEYIKVIKKNAERVETESRNRDEASDLEERRKKTISLLKSARSAVNRASKIGSNEEFVNKANQIMADIEALINEA